MKINYSGEDMPKDKAEMFEELVKTGWTAEHIRKLLVNIRKYSKTGLRHKCSVSMQAMTDYGQIDVDADHWNFETCLRKGVKKLDKQIRRRKQATVDKSDKKSWRKGFWPRFRG